MHTYVSTSTPLVSPQYFLACILQLIVIDLVLPIKEQQLVLLSVHLDSSLLIRYGTYHAYAYGMYHTRMVQFCIPYAYSMTIRVCLYFSYMQLAIRAIALSDCYSFFISYVYSSILLACSAY